MHPRIALASATICSLGLAVTAHGGTTFDVDLNSLGGNTWQLDDTFTINYNLMTAYIDFDQDGVVDTTVDTSGEAWATPSYDGFYIDPEHYVLTFGSSVYFVGNEMSISGSVDWSLSYTTVAGDASTIYSTILFGTMESTGSGAILNIRDGLEWPVSGDQGSPPTRMGFAINDFDSFTYDSTAGTLAANVVPGPVGLVALAGLGLAGRRRSR